MTHLPLDFTADKGRTSVLALMACAMEDEALGLFDLAKNGGPVRRIGGQTSLQILQICDGFVALLITGIGLVNAASSLTWALGQVSPRYVFSCGSAGGVDSASCVGDIVAGATYRYGDADVRAFNYELGQIPGQPAYFEADGDLLSRFTSLPKVLPTKQRTCVGHFVCSDRFVTQERAARVLELFPGTTTVDMESAALAQVCGSFELPFLSLRGISDLCGPRANEENYERAQDAGQASLSVALRLIGLAV